MKKNRLEAFSDGVIAIIITVMVLELKVPHANTISALLSVLPAFLSYVLSFVYIGIYWNNHHHMFYLVDKINGSVLWANLYLLFWLSLVPFCTEWMGENNFSKWPVLLYGFALLMAAIAYTILAYTLIGIESKDSKIARAIGTDRKGKISILFYVLAIGAVFISTKISLALYTLVAMIWFIPDKRVEHTLTEAV